MKLWIPWQPRETLFLGLLIVFLWKELLSKPVGEIFTDPPVTSTTTFEPTTNLSTQAIREEEDTGSDEGIGPFDLSFLEVIIITAVTLGVPMMALSAGLMAFWYKKKLLKAQSAPP